MPIDHSRALHILTDRFSPGELQTLCFELGVDDEKLPGKTHTDKARELIRYLERRERLDDLPAVIARLRPDIQWEDAPAAGFSKSTPPPGPVSDRANSGDVDVRDVAQIGNPVIRALRGVSARITRVLQIGGGRIEIGDAPPPSQGGGEGIGRP